MVLVQLNKEDFEYDIHSLVKAFYPSENVSVYTALKEVSEPVCLHIKVMYEPNHIRIELREWEGSQQERECATYEMQSGFTQKEFAVDDKNRKEKKNLLKQNLYQMLSVYTGRSLPWGTLTGIRPTKIPMAMLEEGRDFLEIADHMEQTYSASREKISLSIEIAQREAQLLHKLDVKNGYSLYIGIPFCPSTCLYCSFTSFPISKWKKRVDQYLDALEKEMDEMAQLFSDKYVNTIYIGGGTPTTLEPVQLERLLSALEHKFDLSRLLEFTVEAGRPDSINREKLEALRKHGISRISINPQTMKQETLNLIGRQHTVEQTIDSFQLARNMGFDNINMDLIMGLPEETFDDVRHTLAMVKELDPDSVTVHSLALKRAARLQMFKEDYAGLKMVNTQKHLDAAAEVCANMGMEPYYLYRQKNLAGNFENVGYAKDGKAGIYNVLIMEEIQSVIALGAGAITKRVHSGGQIERCENVKDVALYMEKINEMIQRKRKLFLSENKTTGSRFT